MVIKSVVTALPTASNTGWGVAGKRITEELSKLAFVQDLNVVNNGIILQQDFPMEFTATVLQAVRGVDMVPMYPHLYGSRRIVGYSFCEDSLLLKRYIRNAPQFWDHVVCGSTWAKDKMVEAGVVEDMVSVAIQGVDTDIFKPLEGVKPDPDYFTVFSGGKFEYRKGQDVVIRAMQVMMERHKDVRLVASWWNPWPASVHTMAQSKLIEFKPHDSHHPWAYLPNMRVQEIREIPHEEMALVINRCDVALFPNRCEAGTNLVMMEAMACGLPVIATYAHGHKDVMKHSGSIHGIAANPVVISRSNGVDSIDVAEWYEPDLEETISLLESSYAKRDYLAIQSLSNLHEVSRFTWENCAKSILEVC